MSDLVPSTTDVVVRLALAALLGGVLGLEREWRKKPAGLRTHMLVALGSATFVVATLRVYASITTGGGGTGMDPTRVIEALVGGLGFLGAGSIIQSRGSVQGLTTAASLWLVGAVGLSAGLGELRLGLAAVALGLVILRGVEILERRALSDPGASS
jgi:putative Mg2+ transporter-C (MgtC) family protein